MKSCGAYNKRTSIPTAVTSISILRGYKMVSFRMLILVLVLTLWNSHVLSTQALGPKNLSSFSSDIQFLLGQFIGKESYKSLVRSPMIKFYDGCKRFMKKLFGMYKLAHYFADKWTPKIFDVITTETTPFSSTSWNYGNFTESQEVEKAKLTPKYEAQLRKDIRRIVEENYDNMLLDPNHSPDVLCLLTIVDVIGLLKTNYGMMTEKKGIVTPADDQQLAAMATASADRWGAASLARFLASRERPYLLWVWDDLSEERKAELEKVFSFEEMMKNTLRQAVLKWWESLEYFLSESFESNVEEIEMCKTIFVHLAMQIYDEDTVMATGRDEKEFIADASMKEGLFSSETRKEQFINQLMKNYINQLSYYRDKIELNEATLANIVKFYESRRWESWEAPTIGFWRPLKELMEVFIPYNVTMGWWKNLEKYFNQSGYHVSNKLSSILSLRWLNATNTACHGITKINPVEDAHNTLRKAIGLYKVNLESTPETEYGLIPDIIILRYATFSKLPYNIQNQILNGNTPNEFYEISMQERDALDRRKGLQGSEAAENIEWQDNSEQLNYEENTESHDKELTEGLNDELGNELGDIPDIGLDNGLGDEPSDEPDDEPDDGLGDEQSDEPGDEQIDGPGDEPIDEPGDESDEGPGDELDEGPGDEPDEGPGDGPDYGPAGESIGKSEYEQGGHAVDDSADLSSEGETFSLSDNNVLKGDNELPEFVGNSMVDEVLHDTQSSVGHDGLNVELDEKDDTGLGISDYELRSEPVDALEKKLVKEPGELLDELFDDKGDAESTGATNLKDRNEGIATDSRTTDEITTNSENSNSSSTNETKEES